MARGALAAMNIGNPVVFKEKQFEEGERERERQSEAKVVYFRDVESFVNLYLYYGAYTRSMLSILQGLIFN